MANTKISVLGCGRWGSFLSWYNAKLGNTVINYGREDSESFLTLKNSGKNEYVTYNPSIQLTSDLAYAVQSSDILIISISSQSLRSFLTQVSLCGIKGKTVVLCMKGIEEKSGLRLSQVALECGVSKDDVAVWVGPGHIQEFTRNVPNCMVIDSYNMQLTARLIDIFKSDLIRFYYGNDIIGTEVGAATKNVMGIVAGILDGLNLTALKGALMSRGSREVARLIKALGGNEYSAYGLCHLGDYETTLFSKFSNNRMWGESYALGQKFSKLAEGVSTAAAISRLSQQVKVEMPITDAVNAMIRDGIPPLEMLSAMFGRNLKSEFN